MSTFVRYQEHNVKLTFSIELMKSMYRQDLALLYFPGISSHSAVNHLTNWIKQCKPLAKALEDAGYKKGLKVLRGKYVELIYEYLGEP